MRLKNGRVVGRADFPDLGVLSKQHLKFTRARRIGWRVRDLDSTRGTQLRGGPIAVDQDFVVKDGERLTIEGETFVFEWRRAADEVAGAAVAVILGLVVLDPATGFGRAVGWVGWMVYLACAVIAGAAAARLTRRYYAGARPGRGLMLALGVALGCAFLEFTALGRVKGLATAVAKARVEYFCLDNFRGRSCVRQIEACAHCGTEIPAPARELIVGRLKAAKLGRPLPER